MTFYHEYIDIDVYVVRGSDGRVWDKTDELYLLFCQSDTPQKISGDEFITIVDGVVVINPDKVEILAQRQANVAAAIAEQQAVESTMVTELPSWITVQTAINNISNLADAKVFLLKLTKVVYQYIKKKTT